MYMLIKRITWLVIAVASVAIGLKACGVDLESMLRLRRFDVIIRYAVGGCGILSLVMLFVERSLGLCCKKQ